MSVVGIPIDKKLLSTINKDTYWYVFVKSFGYDNETQIINSWWNWNLTKWNPPNPQSGNLFPTSSRYVQQYVSDRGQEDRILVN